MLQFREGDDRKDGIPTVKVIDFGLCEELCEGKPVPSSSPRGTLRYMCPKMLNGEIDFKSDVWALGITAFVASHL